MARQVPVSFKDLAVRFSKEEWRLLEEGQREFYRDVMRENYEMLVSVGTTELLPLSAFLSPAEARGATGGGSRADEGQDPSAGGEPQRAQPQHSVHLTALVQLVKDIPELLFGKVEGPEDSPESRGAILDGERASPEEAANKPWPIGREGAGAPGEESSPPTCSPGQRKSHRRQERGTTETGISPGSSPLQGLIDCLKLILVPGPQHPEAAPDLLLPLPIPGASRLSGMELGPGSPPCPVKTESASGDHPLQGRLDCLKEITEAQDRHPSPLGVGDLQLQEDPGPWKRNSGGPRHLQTPPSGAGPGAGSMLTVVKVEDSWPQSPLVPASCQLGRQGHGLSATGDTKEVRTPCWGPTAQASRASSSPLEALEACLKGISPSGSSPPQPLATSWSRSPQLGDAGSQRPDVRPQGSHSEEATREPLQPQGLQGCVREGLAQPLGPRGTPASFSSASSSDGDLDFWSPRGSQGQQPGKGCLPGSSPLQELENCLKELPMPRQQPARPCSSAADREPRRAAPGNWMADEEGAAPRPSPLRCLQSSLRGILPVKPLRFACLAGPGPSPSPSSSLSSSDGEDPRLEPELWRTRLQEIDPLPSYKHPVPPSPCPGRSPRGSSPGKDPERTEPRQCHGLGAGKAEEGTEGKSQLPRKEEGAESACPPSPLHSTRGEGEAAGCPCPAPRLEERPGPRRSEEPGGLGPGHGRCSIAAGAQGRPLPRSPPGPPSKSPPPAAVPPLRPAPSPPACPCGRPLQQELHSLSAALVERLDRLAAALAGLAQEVATVRTQVDRLERRPGSLPRGPRWASGPGHRHRPYWRQKGHTRPKPKILRARAEGCKTGNPPGLAKGRAHLVPQRPTEASLAEPSRPSCDPSQQPSSLAPSCHTVLTGHLPLGHTGCHQSPLPTSVPAAFPALVASSTPSVDAELLTVGAAPASPPHQPKESSGLRGGALREELWGGEHRDPRWGTH